MAGRRDLRTRLASVMEDPSAQAIARVYSTAFLDAIASAESEETLDELASLVDDVLATHPDFAALLTAAGLSRDEKLKLIDHVFAPFASELLTSFLRTLARHDRLELIPLILQQSRLLYEQRSGRKRVHVTSAVALSDEAIRGIQERLRATLSCEPIIEAETDSSLLGGLVIRVDNTIYDSSLKTRLKQLRTRLSERSLHEIQSGRDRFRHSEGD